MSSHLSIRPGLENMPWLQGNWARIEKQTRLVSATHGGNIFYRVGLSPAQEEPPPGGLPEKGPGTQRKSRKSPSFFTIRDALEGKGFLIIHATGSACLYFEIRITPHRILDEVRYWFDGHTILSDCLIQSCQNVLDHDLGCPVGGLGVELRQVHFEKPDEIKTEDLEVFFRNLWNFFFSRVAGENHFYRRELQP